MNKKKISIIYLFSSFLVFLTVIAAVIFSENIRAFVGNVENKTFDLRQKIVAPYKKINKDIVIIEVDTKSYEYIVDKYGEWPIPRSFWGNLITELEKYNPKLVVLDLLFPKRYNKFKGADDVLINAVLKNNNVISAINFDNYEKELREPVDLPRGLSTAVLGDNNLIKKEHEDTNPLSFKNVLPIMDGILGATNNIGFVNFTRDKDGVIRQMPVLCIYKNQYYKNLTFLAALKYLGLEDSEFKIKNNNLILDKNRKIPLTSANTINNIPSLNTSGMAVLNWYAQDFKKVPLWELDKKIQANDTKFLDENFRDKIVYVGTSAAILGDVKTAPLAQYISGVEIHATFLNNILDNNLIAQTNIFVDILIALLLCTLISFIVLKEKSVVLSMLQFLAVIVLYIILSTLLMHFFNIWTSLVLEILLCVLIFITLYLVKYFVKSFDYEQTYKLAVTDGLTGLYNHRYFQEQMIGQIQNYQRYETPFSLILIDIDFFKKFNDKYGHQSGDAVLKQVALMIKSCVRSTDISCRYGGEEMSVILTNTNKEEAVITANKICETVRNTKVTLATGEKANVTISAGVASAPVDGLDVQKLIEYCDKCLYKAKESGRNRVVSEI